MSILAPLLLPALLAASAGDSDPLEILRAADEACRAVRTVAYRVEHSTHGIRLDPTDREMTVWLRKWQPPAPPPPPEPNPDPSKPMVMRAMPMQLAHRLGSSLQADVRVEFGAGRVLVADGDHVTVLDPEKEHILRHHLAHGGERKLEETDTSWAVRTPLLDTYSILHEADGATAVTWAGRKMIDGIECDEVVVDHTPQGGALLVHRWFLGATDHLPRRMGTVAGRDRIEISIRDLAVNIPLPSSTFAAPGAEDYTVEEVKPEPRPEPLSVGTRAPAWSLAAPGGAKTSLADLAGRVVVLDFWGSWCGPCRRAMPDLERLHRAYRGRGVEVVGIACRERDPEAPVRAMQDLECTYRLLLDGDAVAKRYQVPGYPTLFVIDGAGEIAYVHVGFSAELHDELARVIDALLRGTK